MTTDSIGPLLNLAACIVCAAGMVIWLNLGNYPLAGLLAFFSVVNGFFLWRRIRA